MKIWLVHVGEPLPVDRGAERQLRASLMASMLADRGHEVVWWSSTFDHTHKRQRYDRDAVVKARDRLELRLMHARPYSRNISLARLANHRDLANAFERLALPEMESGRPDVIFATLPTLELAASAAAFGRRHRIPTIVDVRDLHPDIYLSLVPRAVRPLARIAAMPLYRNLRTAVSLATGITAIAPSFLDWALRHARRTATDRDAVFPLAYPALAAADEAVAVAGVDLRAAGVRPDRRIIWYVGTFNRWIDLDAPIRAARALCEQGIDDVQVVLSGSGDFEPVWRKLADSLPNVVFTGWIGIPHIIYMRQIAWAGLAPYRKGFHTVGNKLFEYMAGGLPILLSIAGDAKAIVEKHDCGLSYAGESPDSFVEAVHTLMSGGVQSRMAANSLRAYRDHYSADTVYGEMCDFVLGFANTRAGG